MAQALAKVYIHIVFSTKNREARGSASLIVGGAADHVHILCTLARDESISVLIRELKRESSKAMKEKGLRSFYWQAGYGAFSISPAHVAAVKQYIKDQEVHHRRESFQCAEPASVRVPSQR